MLSRSCILRTAALITAHETGIRIKDSLVAASAPPNYVAVSDKDLDSAAKKTPGSPQQQSPAHLFGDQHNDVKPVAKDSLNQVGDKNFIPVAELPGTLLSSETLEFLIFISADDRDRNRWIRNLDHFFEV
ncbi:unnamed protein product [Anisakis simplex]|uniref:PH domain-containing protein n=1 Tax=Anisakis simplex TaxID=6269 RepID=A0A0M3JA30_ANISI|nr:unnamed protein product [Anisakis simplex]